MEDNFNNAGKVTAEMMDHFKDIDIYFIDHEDKVLMWAYLSSIIEDRCDVCRQDKCLNYELCDMFKIDEYE